MYKGYLIKVIQGEIPIELPLKYIAEKTYQAVPKVQDLDDMVDALGRLHRNTLPNIPIKVEFETMSLNNTELESVMSILIPQTYQNNAERSAKFEIYVPEINDYVIQNMYVVQPEPKIKQIDENTNVITYMPLRVAIIGY